MTAVVTEVVTGAATEAATEVATETVTEVVTQVVPNFQQACLHAGHNCVEGTFDGEGPTQ